MTGKRHEKQTERDPQHAQEKAASSDASLPEDNELVGEDCGRRHDAPSESDSWTDADEEELRKHFEEHYNWDDLVRKHGVEGAEMILDCIDFDF